jgi:TP901 family phage tail tape measure protein
MAAQELANIAIKLSANMASFENDLGRASRIAKKESGRIKRDFEQAMLAVKAATLAAGGGVLYAVSKFAKFEQGIAKVGAVAGATTKELKLLISAALQYASSTRFNPEQVTNALYSLSSAGQTVNQQLATLPNVLNLAEAAGADLGRTTELLVSTMSQFDIAASDTQRVSDVLTASISNSATNVERLQVAMRNAGSVATSFNQSFEDTVTAVSILTTSFGNGEKAGTSFSSGLDQLLKNGNKLGINITDATGKIKPFVEILKDLENQGLTSAQVISELGKEGGVGLATLLNKGSAAFEEMRAKLESSGQASLVAAQQMNTLQGDIDQLKSAFDSTVIQIGQFVNENTDVREIVQEVTEVVKNLAETINSIIGTIVKYSDEIILLGKAYVGLFIVRKMKGLLGDLALSLAVSSNAFQKGSKEVFGYTVQLTNAQRAMIATKRVATGLYSAIGGPIGLALFGGYAAWQGINELIDDRREKVEELAKVSDVAAKAMEDFISATESGQEAQALQSVADEMDVIIGKIEELKKKRAELYSGAEFGSGRMIGSAALQNTQDEIDGLEKQLQTLKGFQAVAGGVKMASEAMGKLGDAYTYIVAKGNELTQTVDSQVKSVDDWIKASEKQLEALIQQNAEYGKSAEQIVLMNAAKQLSLTTDAEQIARINKVTQALIEQIRVQERNIKATEKKNKAAALAAKFQAGLANVGIGFVQSMDISNEALQSVGLTATDTEQRAKELENTILALALAFGENNPVIEELKEQLESIGEEVEKIDFEGIFDGFAAGLNPVLSGLQRFKDEIAAIDKLSSDPEFAGSAAFYKTGLAAEFALNSMASMAEEGSRSQAKLAAAAEVANTVLGISAILTQGQGDPWTAIPRMIAMAAMVASTGTKVTGSFSGSGSGGAEQRQEVQGTGTVLGDAEAKSESIQNALDIIASASEKIVGINSSMLRSLKSMNDAISGTATEIAKFGGIGELGTKAGGFSGLSSIFGGTGVTGFLDGLIFGKSKVKDRGIEILGGRIADAINGDIFQAYEVARRSGIFGSSTRTGRGDLDDGITSQISLIFESMGDAVLAGAEALGMNMDDVQNALETYQIEAQRISLMDLNSEEQQAQLEAVFSSIFDGLTAFSIPFITQFQEAGEGLGETLARVSTTVLVFEEAIDSMGLDFIAKELDPELFAQAAVAISEFAGGMDEFIDGYTTYISKFLSESEQLDILTDRISGVFGDLGLTLPGTRDGFKELMEGLDLTTEAGREAFGTLIALSGQMDSYYSSIESNEQEAIAAREKLDAILSDITDSTMSDFALSLKNIRKAFEQNIKTARELGASERELAMIQTHATRQIQQAIQALEDDIGSALTDLYGTELDRINEQIALLESQESQISAVQSASDNLYESQLRAVQGIKGFLDSILLDEQLSPLNPQEQLAEAQSQFDALLAAAQGGDVDAMNALPAIAQTLLGFGQQVFASSSDYVAIFDNVMAALESVGVTATEPTSDPQSIIIGQNGQMIELLAERNRLEDEFNSEARLQAALAIADQIRDLASVTGESFGQLAERLGIPVELFLADLGVSLDTLTVETALALGQTAQLLGVEITELAASVGVSLGDLADQNSLINDALEATIESLPDGIQGTLSPLLTAIETATDPEIREQLLNQMVEYIDGLPEAERDLLAPYFDQIDPTTEAQQQVNQMSLINDSTIQVRDELVRLIGVIELNEVDNNRDRDALHREVQQLNTNITNLVAINGG